MKITIIQGAFLPVPALRGGAVEKMWFSLGAEFAARGHEVVHLSRRCDGLPGEERISGVRHVRIPGYEHPRGGLRLKLLDLLYSRRACAIAPAADLVVTNTFWSPLLLRPRQGKIYVDVQRMPKGQMRLYGRAARLRANSSAVEAAILAEAPTAKPRVCVIPNSLPFTPERPVEWARKTKTVLYAGRIHPEKGIELLLEAWAKAQQKGRLRDWRLELVGPVKVGEGGGGEEWVSGLQRRYTTPGIDWRAPIYDAEGLNRAYERAMIFAYPSLAEKGETFGVAVLEAMAWGAIPVVSDLACFRDLVTPEHNGLVFNHRGAGPAEALLDALERAARGDAQPMAEEAVRRRESHSSAAIAERFLEDFARLG